MTDHSSALHGDGQDLLASALSDAFSPVDLPRQSVTPSTTSLSLPSLPSSSTPSEFHPDLSPPPPPVSDPPAPSASAAEHDAWKAEYEAQVATWHRESAERREKAKQVREEWERKREKEKKEMEKVREELVKNYGVESLSWAKVDAVSGEASPALGDAKTREELVKRAEAAMTLVQEKEGETSVADARALVPGEAEGKHSIEFIERALPRAGPVHATIAIQTTDAQPEPDSNTAAQESSAEPSHAQDPSHDPSSPNWEDVPSSMDSSFPSMSFPDASRTHSETPSQPNTHGHTSHHDHTDNHHHHTHTHRDDKHTTGEGAEKGVSSATFTVFDNTLSTRTRAWALVSSVAINMFLPFVNGVMLGFGELFAKQIIAPWLGWKPAGMGVGLSGAAAGARAADRRKEERKGAGSRQL